MNSFGTIFKVQIFGESHGEGIGVVIDGCPAGIEITKEMLFADLQKRKAGKKGTTPRIEQDIPKILSGIFNNKSNGNPISLFFSNNNTKSSDYQYVNKIPRPGHADFVANKKHKGFNDYRGGGHFSGRLTVGIVAAGVIAKQIIKSVTIKANITEVGGSSDINQAIENALKMNTSIGAIIECKANGIPIGLGEPFWDSVESIISHSMFAIPGIKGIEFGNGFKSSKLFGHENNDCFINENGQTASNNSGGINGGMSNGNELIFRVAVKPTSSIGKTQQTFNFETKQLCELQTKGRHDTCFALRVPPIVEAMTAICLADLTLRNNY